MAFYTTLSDAVDYATKLDNNHRKLDRLITNAKPPVSDEFQMEWNYYYLRWHNTLGSMIEEFKRLQHDIFPNTYAIVACLDKYNTLFRKWVRRYNDRDGSILASLDFKSPVHPAQPGMLQRPNLDASCIADIERQAGDLWPTAVTPDDARRYIDEVDAGYSRLDTAIQASSTPSDFKASWGFQIAAWKAFAISSKATVGWFNTRAVMNQTDTFNQQLRNWFDNFQASGGKPPGPPPSTPKDDSTAKSLLGNYAVAILAGITLAFILRK